MNYEEALEYIHGISWTFCKPGLERISALCKALGEAVFGVIRLKWNSLFTKYPDYSKK